MFISNATTNSNISKQPHEHKIQFWCHSLFYKFKENKIYSSYSKLYPKDICLKDHCFKEITPQLRSRSYL